MRNWEDSSTLVCVDCSITFRLSEFVVNTQLFGIPEGSEGLALRCDVESVDPYQLHRRTPCGRVRVGSIEVVLEDRQCVDVRHLKKKKHATSMKREIDLKEITTQQQKRLSEGHHCSLCALTECDRNYHGNMKKPFILREIKVTTNYATHKQTLNDLGQETAPVLC